MPVRSHPCDGWTVAGRPCANTIANPSQRYCGKCAGAKKTDTLEEAAVDARTGLARLREQQISADEFHVSGSTGEDLADRPTAELVREFRSRTGAAVEAQAKATALGTDASPGAGAVRDQAQAARREASRYQDAILLRHSDPYGAALVRAGWEAAAPVGEMSESQTIRAWLAANPGAGPDDIHLALNTIAEREVGPEKLADSPWVNDLNRVASLRAASLHDPAAVDQRRLQQAEAMWKVASPAGAR